MNFSDLLLKMLEDMEKHRRNKDNLLEFYIQKRLNNSIQNYYKDLLKSYKFLSHKDPKKLLNIINKETK